MPQPTSLVHFPRVAGLFLLVTFPAVSAGNSVSTAGDPPYAVSAIPAELKGDAKAVIRLDHLRFEVADRTEATETRIRAVTIFHQDERNYGVLVIPYDRFTTIEDLDGVLYDAHGRKIRTLSSSDVKDYSAVSEYSLYDDNRVRIASLFHDQYPYTVVHTYELSHNGYLSWPTWYARRNEDPVELSRFEIVLPRDQELRYWSATDSLPPSISTERKQRCYRWEASNLPPLDKDALSDDIEDVTLVVRTAPALFELQSHRGSMNSWREFGQWYAGLLEKRHVLPPAALNDVGAMIDTSDSPRQKVQKLYRYMQNRTRYVSIQLGIGGWQPFDARFVHERGYGDCKALVNYMSALLSATAIRSFPVLIRSGSYRRPFIEELPSNQFNHVILAVPLDDDTVWLECTSPTMPFGRIGASNENRGALMVTPQGGVVVRTPSSRADENLQLRTAIVRMVPNGAAEAAVRTEYSGNQRDRVRGMLDESMPEDVRRWILAQLQAPAVSLANVEIDGTERNGDTVRVAVVYSLQRHVTVSGTRRFFHPNFMERRTSVPKPLAARLSPVRFGYPYTDIDSIVYILPPQYQCEAIPPDVEIASSFGSFRTRIIQQGDTLLSYERRLLIHDREVPADRYPEYRQFFARVVQADRAQVVLTRKDR